mmetsp:Transcript_44159/g.127497  ORF Transcript_44159/g.127497 Transcript_44159/m.127497 type:complete len:244 (-) Transcript_44159:545-1276(-)
MRPQPAHRHPALAPRDHHVLGAATAAPSARKVMASPPASPSGGARAVEMEMVGVGGRGALGCRGALGGRRRRCSTFAARSSRWASASSCCSPRSRAAAPAMRSNSGLCSFLAERSARTRKSSHIGRQRVFGEGESSPALSDVIVVACGETVESPHAEKSREPKPGVPGSVGAANNGKRSSIVASSSVWKSKTPWASARGSLHEDAPSTLFTKYCRPCASAKGPHQAPSCCECSCHKARRCSSK